MWRAQTCRFSSNPGVGSGSPGARVKGGCESLSVSGGNKNGPLQKLQELLIPEPSL